MSALQSFRSALNALRVAPVLFLGGLAFAVAALPSLLVSFAQQVGVVSGLGASGLTLALGVVVLMARQYVIGGAVGMADEALDGGTSFGTFTAAGADSYLAILLATLVRVAVEIAYGIVAAIVGFVVLLVVVGSAAAASAGGGAAGLGALGAGTLALVAVVGIVLGLAFALIQLLFAFYAPAIVIDGDGPVDAVRSSVGVVTGNPLAAAGYVAVSIVIGLVAALPTSGIVYFRTFQRLQSIDASATAGGPSGLQLFSVPEAAAVVLVAFATTMLVAPVNWTFTTAFYRDHRRREGGDAAGVAARDEPGGESRDRDPVAGLDG